MNDDGGPLATVFSTALNVWLARTVYADPASNPAELTDTAILTTSRQIEDHLLGAFLPTVFRTEPEPPTVPGHTGQWRRQCGTDRACVWLRFLATHLHRLKTPDLAWWRLRDALPPTGVSLAFCLIGGLAFGVAGELRDGRGYLFGLTGGVAAGLASAFRKTPEPRYADLRGMGYIRSFLRLLGRAVIVALVFWLAGWPDVWARMRCNRRPHGRHCAINMDAAQHVRRSTRSSFRLADAQALLRVQSACRRNHRMYRGCTRGFSFQDRGRFWQPGWPAEP